MHTAAPIASDPWWAGDHIWAPVGNSSRVFSGRIIAIPAQDPMGGNHRVGVQRHTLD
jgi:hypothetical protein